MDNDGEVKDGNLKKSKQSTKKENTKLVKYQTTESSGSDEKRKTWININNEYVFPRTFLEYCVVFVQRSGSTLIIRTTEDYNDLTMVFHNENDAIHVVKEIHDLMNSEDISCKVNFDDVE